MTIALNAVLIWFRLDQVTWDEEVIRDILEVVLCLMGMGTQVRFYLSVTSVQGVPSAHGLRFG